MKRSERGFTLIELLLVIAIVAGIALASGAATTQLFASSKRTNDHITATRQVQNAGFWISRDAMMADNATFDNETPADFLTLTWTEWSYEVGEDSIYHSVIYSLQNPSGGIAMLRRTHESSAGADEQTLVAEYIYYNPDEDFDNTTKVISYENSVLTVQITSSFGEASEIREYEIWHRRDF